MDESKNIIDVAKKVKHIWKVFYKAHEDDYLSFNNCDYLGYDVEVSKMLNAEGKLVEKEITIFYKKVYSPILCDDDDYNESEHTHIETIKLPLKALDMTDDDLKKFFIQKTKRKETLQEIAKYDREIKRLTDGIKKFNSEIAELKSPDYLENKIKQTKSYADSWLFSLNKQKKYKKDLEDLLNAKVN